MSLPAPTHSPNGEDQHEQQQESRRQVVVEEKQQEAPLLEEWEIQRDGYKQDGDDAFRNGDLQDAVFCYTNALALDPTNYILRSNRSAAYLKLNYTSKALADAKACLESNPDFIKGYSRLASAYYSLKRYQDAKHAFEELFQRDATSTVAKEGIQNCNLKLNEMTKKEYSSSPAYTEGHATTAATNERQAGEQQQDDKNEDGEDNLLDDFFAEVEEAVAKPGSHGCNDDNNHTASPSPVLTTATLISDQKKELGSAQDQMNRLLQPNYKWRNLNPYHVLDISHTASDEAISRQYKALSLLLHPDKCCHLTMNNKTATTEKNDIISMKQRAKEAYDQVQTAKKILLDDPDKARHVRGLVEQGMKLGKQLWKTRHTNNNSLSLEDYQQREVARIFAQIEHERVQIEQRERQYEARERQQEEDELDKLKRERVFDRKWRDETRVDKRIGNWRDFSTATSSGSTKKRRPNVDK